MGEACRMCLQCGKLEKGHLRSDLDTAWRCRNRVETDFCTGLVERNA